MKNKLFLLFLVLGIVISYGADDITMCGIRVSFAPDQNDATTGNGQFLLSQDSVDMDILEPLPVDPPPHDKYYFQDHFKAVANYYEQVSGGAVQIDTFNSRIFPDAATDSYQLESEMAYYHPFLQEDSVDIRLNELISDAIQVADSDVDFSDYDLVVIFHAGLGQIYNIEMDPTPKDIKSAYMGQKDFDQYLGLENGIQVDDGENYVTDAIILPETQNYIQYDNWDKVFGQLENPQEYQFGLNGTFALMMGFYLGLPSLSDTAGGSGVGKFGLMDQGSANLNSLVPGLPSAWERTYLGWEEPITINQDHPDINIPYTESGRDSTLLKIPIDSDEYYLVENRCNFLHSNVNLDTLRNREYRENEDQYEDTYPSLLPFIKDSIGAQFSDNGVLLSAPRYDVGLPGSGLLIWHIDENIINKHIDDNMVNISKYEHGVDLEEGDGAQDFGFEGPILGPNVEVGWAFDPWYAGNQGFFELNPEYDSNRDSLVDDRVGFTPYTTPSTSNNNHAFTGISIDSIGPAGFNMDFRIKWDIESGSKIAFSLPDEFAVLDIIPVDLGKNLDGLAVAGNEIIVYDSLGNQIISDNSLDLAEYSTAKLFFDQNNKNLFMLAENEQNLMVAGWQFNNSGDLNFQDSVIVENTITTSNAILIGNSLMSSVVESGNNMLIRWELTDQGFLKSDQSINDTLQSLTGNENNCYYLSENKLGKIDPETLSITELFTDSRISGNTLFSGYLNNNEDLDLVLNGGESSGVVLDINETAIIRTISPGFGKIALSDFDGDGRSEILNITASGELTAYNANLNLENNFPVKIGQELAGEPLSYDVNGNQINDVVLVTNSGELYAFDYKGNRLGSFPLTTEIADPDRLCLMNAAGGQVAFVGSQVGTNQIGVTKTGQGLLTGNSWFCQGGNTSRSFLLDGVETQQVSESLPVLNKEKTFCWPNPVKQSTTNIRYFVNRPATVKIDIYDLAGNFVKSFKDENSIPLEYNEISWNVDNIESGVYFAMVKASDDNGSQKEIIKIMVIK